MFPQTLPVTLKEKHFKIIKVMLQHPEGILQKHIVQKTGIDKTTVSEIIDELSAIGWCIRKELYITKEVKVIMRKMDSIKRFLGYCQAVGKHIPFRPHDIILDVSILKSGDLHPNVFYKLSVKYPVVISGMKNNLQYIYRTEWGNIQMNHKGNKVKFVVTEILVPLQEEDLNLYEEYLTLEILYNFDKLYAIVKEHFGRHKIKLSNVIHLKTLHLGILTVENVAKVLKMNQILKDLGVYQDKSIAGLKETEANGNPEKVYNKMKVTARMAIEVYNSEES